jgi:hypothetical protein
MPRARTPKPNKAVLAARERRAGQAAARDLRIQWFIREVSDKVAMTTKHRVRIATDLVFNRVVQNISRPVTKGTGPRGGRVVTDRSKPGEFFKAETTHAMKTTFREVRETSPGVFEGFVGTPLDYPLILETKMNRLYLVETLNRSRADVQRILTGPIR